MELTIHALSHSYGDKKALTGFTHTFAPGITALLGPNGAGKSTLIHLICDLLPRQTGTIAFDGTDILSMGPAFRQVLGFMPQSQGMYDDMTAWEFLLYMAQLKGLRPRAAREQLRELLQVVNLWDAAHRRVGGFSGGMRQRVMLAQVVANNLKEQGAGFAGDTNIVTIITSDSVKELPLMTKEETAGQIIDEILARL